MENDRREKTYPWERADEKKAIVKGALEQAQIKQARIKEELSEANRSVWALQEQLRELEADNG